MTARKIGCAKPYELPFVTAEAPSDPRGYNCPAALLEG